jgi:hypothetical protein
MRGVERQGVFTTAHIECKDFSQGYAPKHTESIQGFPRSFSPAVGPGYFSTPLGMACIV